MLSIYPILRGVHIGCIYTSIGLFVLRYVLDALGFKWRKSFALRVMPHLVDTLLLASAIALCFIIQQFPFVNAWLTVKVAALVAYIVLGAFALRVRAPTMQRVFFIAAVAVFAFIISVARSHAPWGALARFL